MIINYFFFTLLLVLLWIFFSTTKQYMMAMLILKSLVLISLVLILFILCMYGASYLIFIMLLTLGVCEAGLGLSLLISNIKLSGSSEIRSTFL
uniref:NADH dehydrogenase subunit 4L n=1 Tax=Megalophaedusa expansilabris TaxID=1885698 RepID=A0A224ABU5_9EUPU|nr:NADH dehydrogenase subunit 4L [Megalophaedusa expansilabris]